MNEVLCSLPSHPVAKPATVEATAHGCVEAFVDEMIRGGVRHVCISPGARSTPLVLAVAARPELHAWSHVDERSGSFFALGIAKATRAPVAIVCTSGTAAANFYPAVIEAAYAHVPLLVLTADRPAELRDCGAPQAIDQIKLYGSHVKWFVDVGGAESGERYFRSLACQAVATAQELPVGPVHLNFPFREPLVAPILSNVDRSAGILPVRRRPHTSVCRSEVHPTAASLDTVAAILAAKPRGLIACGPSDAVPEVCAAVLQLAAATGYPILADPASQLRRRRYATAPLVDGYDILLREDRAAAGLSPDVVFRVGAMQTSKAFARYLDSRPQVHQIVLDSDGSWQDPLHRTADLLRGDASFTCRALADRVVSLRRGAPPNGAWQGGWTAASSRAHRSLSEQIEQLEEMFEGKVFSELARRLPDGVCLYVGNSMAIRDLEAFWPADGPEVRILCNRGANGIDGFVSSGLGAAAVGEEPVVIVTGDLGFYHDLNGLLAAKRYRLRTLIIVLNNDGGGIFSYLPQADCGRAFDEYFLTSHGLDFRPAVEMYGCKFHRTVTWPDFRSTLDDGLRFEGTTVLEVPVNRERSVELHRAMFGVAARAAAEVD